MGRPKAFDRDQAIEATMHEIWRNGYSGSSVNSLADTLGITRSSFYNAFGDRESLFKEILGRYVAEAPDSALNDIKPGDPVIPAILDMFERVCEVRASDPEGRGCMLVNCLAELASAHDELGPLLENAVKAGTKRFHRLLKQAARQGEIPDRGDLHEIALALQNCLAGINLISKVVRRKKDLRAIAKQTLSGLGLAAEK
jgi:TetR/AcrR family transcriptional repressor of nem operon